MVKRITFSVSDELHDKIQHFKEGFRKRYSISKICQEAIEEKLGDAVHRYAIYKDGLHYGQEYVEKLTSEECINAKRIVENFPRNYPDELITTFMKEGLITQDSLKKHMDILEMWKTCVYDRVREIEEVGTHDDWDSWLGTPPKHEGVDIFETEIPAKTRLINLEGKEIEFTSTKSSADIRHGAMRDLWREGLIAGIKEATESIKEEENEDE